MTTRNSKLFGVWSSRPSFTLIELLIVITIIGILAGMVMYTLAGAQRDAAVSKTEATIRKLNEIILGKWEEFRYRSVKVNLPQNALETFVVGGQKQTILSPREGARLRMLILRDTMRMEFPDRYTDILFPPTNYQAALYTADNGPPSNNNGNDTSAPLNRDVPANYTNLRRKIAATGVLSGTTLSPTFPSPVNQAGGLKPGISERFQAELLYQIVATTTYQGSNALEYFRQTEIGDVDDDGMPEFIDGWGNPIRWIRWPAGYGYVNPASFNVAQLQADPDLLNRVRPGDYLLNDKTVPDPMDPLRTDWRWSLPAFSAQRPWMLVPLIVSAGPDGEFDIQFDEATAISYADYSWPGPTDSPRHYINGLYYWIDPYRGYYDNSSGAIEQGGLGQFSDENAPSPYGAGDNITNYALIMQ